MEIVNLTTELLAPWIRFVIFAVFTFSGTVGSYVLMDVFNDKYYTDGGLKPIETDSVEYVHVASIIVLIVQIFSCIMCAIKVIHIPHTPYKVEKTWSEKYIWQTHEAIFLMIASGINSNLLAEKFFESKFFKTIYDDGGGVVGSEQFHDILRLTMLYSRFTFAGFAWGFIIYNFVAVAKNQYWRQPPSDPMEWVSLGAVTAIFVTQIIYSVTHFIELHPDSLKKQYPTDPPAIIKERHLEFISENISEVSLGVIGVALTWLSVVDTDLVNSLATTEIFNTIFLGFYGSMCAVKSAFAVHFLKGDINTAWVPLVVFVGGASLSLGARVIAHRSDIRNIARNQVYLFYNAVGQNYSIISFIWRLGLAGGIAAMLIAVFSTQAQWFTFQIIPGAIPNSTAAVAENVVGDITHFGHKAFSILKDLDPCRWGTNGNYNNAKLDIKYTGKDDIYGERPPNAQPKNPFNIKHYDITNPPQGDVCRCSEGKSDCGCSYIDGIQRKIKGGDAGSPSLTQKKENLAKDHLDAEMDRFKDKDGNPDFTKWDDTSPYVDKLKECHTTECDIVMGVAIASEVAIMVGDSLSFLPFVGEAIDTAAWLGQMGNRIAHNVVTYGMKLAKLLAGLAKRLTFLEPLLGLLLKIQKTIFKKSFAMSLDLLMVYIPLVINGSFCILIAFWRRENVHKMFQTYGVIVTFYIPLILLNASMYGLMFLFPEIINDVVKIIPHLLFTVVPTEHVGFSLLRKAYLMSTVTSFLLLLSSMLDDAYYIRRKAGTIRNALRGLFKRQGAQTSIDVWEGGVKRSSKWVDGGWFQAFTVSIAIPILFGLSYHYEWKFVDLHYGPSGPLLKIVNAFHGHTNILQDTNSHNDFVDENSLCGLVGKAVGTIIADVIKELEGLAKELALKLGAFVESVLHLSNVISTFEGIGTKTINILEDTWDVAEKTLVLIVPLLLSVLITITTFVLPHVNDKAKVEIEKTVKHLILMGIYYNVSLLVMMNQLFSTISNLKLYIFYFRFNPGLLVPIGFLASFLNALALFSLYVNSIYKSE
jgi:hypothetical protein